MDLINEKLSEPMKRQGYLDMYNGVDILQTRHFIVAHRVGSDMCYWLMPVSGVPVVNSSVQHVTADERRNPEIMHRIEDFNTRLNARLDEDTNFARPGGDIDDFYPNDVYEIPTQDEYATRRGYAMHSLTYGLVM